MTIPANPQIYHITHVENLPQILTDGVLWSDVKRIELGLQNTLVGMREIKRRRIESLFVSCHSSTTVGQYVPFYFCPRSVMLFILHCSNHPDIEYREGQKDIIHLQFDMRQVVEWATQHSVLWAFSDRNAGTYYARFFDDLSYLDQLNWPAISSRDFRDVAIKDGKQAEFLLYENIPIQLVKKIGVQNREVYTRTVEILNSSDYDINVSIESNWYF